MNNKLGFIVGHPTQFEGPMYQYFTRRDESFLNVYFYTGAKTSFVDKELSSNNKQSWGIDIFSGYSYKVLGSLSLKLIKEIFSQNRYIIVNGYINKFTIILLLAGKIFGRKVGLRLDTVSWNNISLFKKVTKRILIKLLNIFVDTYWVVGSKSKEYLSENGVEPNKVKYLSYVVDNDWFKSNSSLLVNEKIELMEFYKIPLGKKIVLCVSKLVERELPIDVIDAFEKMNNSNVILLIVGDGNKRDYLEQYAKEKLPQGNYSFIGYVKYFQLPEIYAICDVFIHPSKNEPWGVSVQEALACGKPVITSNFVGAGYDLIKEGKNGFMYNFLDSQDLAYKIEAALKLNPKEVEDINMEILESWNYSSAYELIDNHIECL